MVIGIDPGAKTGAYCMLSNQGIERLENFPLLDGMVDYWTLKSNNFLGYKAVIEKAYTRFNQGGVEATWRNYERLILAFDPELEVTSTAWRKLLNIPLAPKELKKDAERKAWYLDYEYNTFTKSVKMANGELIDWHKILPSGKRSKNLDSGKIEAYCIARAYLE